MKYFASRIAQRVITSLILAGIFGVLATCAKADVVGPTVSATSGSASVSLQITYVPGSSQQKITVVSTPGAGFNCMTRTYLPGGTVDDACSITSTTDTLQPYPVGTTAIKYKVRAWDGSYSYSAEVTLNFTSDPVARTITLNYTNPSSGSADLVSSWMWAGWATSDSTWAQDIKYVGPGESVEWLIESPVGDTKQYRVITMTPAAWTAAGPKQTLYPLGSPEDLAGNNLMDFGDDAVQAGATKDYDDGVDGTDDAVAQTTPPAPVSNPSGPSSATPSTPPGGTATTPNPLVQKVTPPAPSSAPTQQTAADGTNAILAALNALKGAVQQGTAATGGIVGVGGGTDMSGVESRLDTANEHLTAIEEATEGLRSKEDYDEEKSDAEEEATSKAEEGISQGATAGAAAAGLVNSKGGGAPSGLGYTPGTGDGGYASALIIAMPASFGGASVNLNPFSNAGMMTVAHWFRSAVAWLAYATLGVFIWKEMGEWIRSGGTARQATGNTVFAGTGAQATALTNAVLITAAAVVLFTAMMAWSMDSISFSLLRTNALTNPLAGMPAVALGMLSEILPVATLISCLIARYTFNFYASALFATYSAVVRFFIA